MIAKVLVCPIAFNENVKLQRVIERFLRSSARALADYLIVDDASNDGTEAVIASFAAQGVKTLRHSHRQGVGAAIRSAICYAQREGYAILVIMAGNDKDDPEEISRIVDPLFQEDYDFVQGSRYLGKPGIGGDMPLYRKWATRLHPWVMAGITGKKVTDTTNGFRGFHLRIFEDPQININQPWLDQYELEPYLLFKALTRNFRFKEVPVTKIYPPKKLGYTKMKPISGWWSILRPLVYLGLGIKK